MQEQLDINENFNQNTLQSAAIQNQSDQSPKQFSRSFMSRNDFSQQSSFKQDSKSNNEGLIANSKTFNGSQFNKSTFSNHRSQQFYQEEKDNIQQFSKTFQPVILQRSQMLQSHQENLQDNQVKDNEFSQTILERQGRNRSIQMSRSYQFTKSEDLKPQSDKMQNSQVFQTGILQRGNQNEENPHFKTLTQLPVVGNPKNNQMSNSFSFTKIPQRNFASLSFNKQNANDINQLQLPFQEKQNALEIEKKKLENIISNSCKKLEIVAETFNDIFKNFNYDFSSRIQQETQLAQSDQVKKLNNLIQVLQDMSYKIKSDQQIGELTYNPDGFKASTQITRNFNLNQEEIEELQQQNGSLQQNVKFLEGKLEQMAKNINQLTERLDSTENQIKNANQNTNNTSTSAISEKPYIFYT